MKKTAQQQAAAATRLERIRADLQQTLRRSYRTTIAWLPRGARTAFEDLATRVESGREDLFAAVEQAVLDAVRPFVGRLDLATRNDLERLTKRLNQLERKLAAAPQSDVAA